MLINVIALMLALGAPPTHDTVLRCAETEPIMFQCVMDYRRGLGARQGV